MHERCMRRDVRACAAVILGIGLLLAGPIVVYIMFRPGPEARSELRALDESIALGSSSELALRLCVVGT